MEQLRRLLTGFVPGPIIDNRALAPCLAAIWDDLIGSGDGGMRADKLAGRMESVVWEPPDRLTFNIERHGGTVNGSTRAEVQHWVVDLKEMSATLKKSTQRQLRQRDSPVTKAEMIKAAEAAVELVAGGREDEGLKWGRDGRVHVIVNRLIFVGSFQRTEAGRRKRMRPILDAAMAKTGWLPEGRNVYRRCDRQGKAQLASAGYAPSV